MIDKTTKIILTFTLVFSLGLGAFLAFNFAKVSQLKNQVKTQESTSSITDKNISPDQAADNNNQEPTVPEAFLVSNLGVCEVAFDITTPTQANCQNIKFYTADWTEITDKTTINRGDSVNIAVTGQITAGTNPGQFTKARFSFDNGSTWQATSTKNPSGEFYISYTFPQDTLSVSIQAQIYHDQLSWLSADSCNQTLTFTEQYQCAGLTTDVANPAKGQTVNYTCSGTGDLTGGKAKFRMMKNATVVSNTFKSVKLVVNGSNGSAQASYTIPSDDGEYVVQCRICTASNTCTAWGKAN